MSRRAQAPVRQILPDPKFSNLMLAKFMNVIMKNGKTPSGSSAVGTQLPLSVQRFVRSWCRSARDRPTFHDPPVPHSFRSLPGLRIGRASQPQ